MKSDIIWIVLLASWLSFAGIDDAAAATRYQQSPADSTSQPQEQQPGDVEIPAEAAQLDNTAANLQNNGEFKLAAETWRELLDKFPEIDIANKARYYLGICLIKTDQYAAAEGELLKTVAEAGGDRNFSFMPEAHLWLGYAQYQLGKTLTGEEQAKKYAAAINTFTRLLNDYADTEWVDDALYFRAEVEYFAGDVNQSAATLQRLTSEFGDSRYHEKSLRDLAVTYSELAEYAQALDAYDRYVQTYADGEWIEQVQLDRAQTMVELGKAAEYAGAAEEAQRHFTTARDTLAGLAADEAFPARDEALFRQAFCSLRLGEIALAADLFATLVNDYPQSDLAPEAAISAGRYYFRAGNLEVAKQWLEQVRADQNQYSAEAVHWLARIGIIEKDYANVAEMALAAAESAADTPLALDLLMDAGDALFELPERRAEAAQIYLRGADEFPNHQLAPQALYNAAFATLLANQLDEAIELARRFETDFPDHDFLPDTQEVIAEAKYKAGELQASRQQFANLVERYADHPNLPRWINRVGLLHFQQEEFQQAIDWLAAQRSLLSGAAKAEASYRIGFSHFRLGQFQAALNELKQADEFSEDWGLADDSRLLLGRCFIELQDFDAAASALNDFEDAFPESDLTVEARYRLGETYFEQGQLAEARQQYDAVLQAGDTQFKPYAMYGLAWVDLKQENHQAAREAFDALVQEFPDHELHKDAVAGLGMTYRQTGDLEQSITRLNEYLSTDPPSAQRISALYERGLAEAELARWQEAQTTFQTLIEIAPEHSQADQFYYELAWADKQLGNAAAALTAFRTITQNHANSQRAPEAYFHLAAAAYDDGDYAKAIEGFEFTRTQATSDSLIEKSMYKLGRAYFQLQQYDEARQRFQDLVDNYPAGELAADALSMIAETHFKSRQNALAVTAFKKAIPEIEKSESALPDMNLLARLHGAQAANAARDYQTALDFALPILDQKPDWEFVPEVRYEIGAAHYGLKQTDQAVAQWNKIAEQFNHVGARARFMIGQALFGQQQYDSAINQFKLVLYGYGGDQASAETRHWQALSAYEAARCSYVRINDTTDAEMKRELGRAARSMFELYLEKFPGHDFEAEAQKGVSVLKKLGY